MYGFSCYKKNGVKFPFRKFSIGIFRYQVLIPGICTRATFKAEVFSINSAHIYKIFPFGVLSIVNVLTLFVGGIKSKISQWM